MAVGRPRSFDPDDALGAVLRVFWERGYGAASTDALADAAGVTKPSLYAAFGDKRGQFAAAWDLYLTQSLRPPLALLGESGAAGDGVRAWLRDSVERFTDPANPPGCLVTLHSAGAGGSDETVRELATAADAEVRAALRTRLREAKAAGERPAGGPVGPVADRLAALRDGMSVAARLGRSRRDLLAAADRVVTAAFPDTRG